MSMAQTSGLDHRGVEGRSRYELYFEFAPDGILLVDRTGRILEANPATAELLGYTVEELLSLSIWETVAASAQAAAATHFGDVTARGEASGDVSLVRKDGSTLTVEINAVALGADRFIGFLRDVTRHREAELSHALHTRAFQASGEAVVITDLHNRIVSVNPAFTRITGYAFDEVRGQNPKILASGRHSPEFYQSLWKSLDEHGHWEGQLWNRRKNGEIYAEWATLSTVKHRDQVVSYVAVFSDLTSRHAAEAEATFLAHHDALTQLANRSLMEDRLTQSIARAAADSTQVALLYVDLDEFKTINESLGHHLGDELLQSVASRLKNCVRGAGTVARLGGDEFALVVPGLRDGREAGHLAQRVLLALELPHQLKGREINTSASVGIAIYPHDGADAQTLARCADAAMFAAKARGRNNHQFFRKEMTAQVSERLEIEHRLRHAMERGHLSLHYQPQIGLRSGKTIGVEGLLRWTDPDLGPVSPARFIPIAEETGLIVPLGEWVLRAAASQCRAWQDSGMRDLSVAVNISAAQFRRRDFLELVDRVIHETGVDPRMLELEVTEGVVMHEGASECLHALREMGLALAIDDFGTGYSSLSYLKHFPIDRLKIDQSFVRNLSRDRGDLEIVRAVVALGHAFGLVVLAEGVETREQVEQLLSEGCDQAQGWFYSRAVPAADIAGLARQPPSAWVVA